MFEYAIIVVVVLHLWWTWHCCRKAQQAYWAAAKLYKWVGIVHDPLICTVEATGSCKDSGPGWPPSDIGTFPPDGA